MSESTVNSIPTENTAICEHCGMKVKANAQFCSACGKPVISKPLKIFCQTCGTELSDDEMFCPKCGSSTSQNKNAEALNNIAAYNASLDTTIKQKPKKKKWWKVLLIIIGLLAALAVVGYFVILPEYNYQEACSALKRGSYSYAISCFEDLGDYKDSQTKILEAKYRYVENNLDNSNRTTFDYLKELKYESYKDSAEIYEDLYEWKIEVFAWNSSENGTTNNSSISKYKAIYCHFRLTGGTPGGSTRVSYSVKRPNGDTDDRDYFDFDMYDGSEAWWGFPDGLYAYPEYGTTGTVSVQFYDEDNNLIGTGSVRITS